MPDMVESDQIAYIWRIAGLRQTIGRAADRFRTESVRDWKDSCERVSEWVP